MSRPDAIGLEVTVDSLEQADLVLAEMSWLQAESAKAKSHVEQRITSLKEQTADLLVITVGDSKTTLAERYDTLETALLAWAEKNLQQHLTNKKSIDLKHGTIGFRQQPMSVELVDKGGADTFVEKVDKSSEGLVTKMRAALERRIKSLACWLTDLLVVKVTPNLSGIKKAIADKRLTVKNARSLGVAVREAHDAPYATPAECMAVDA